MMQGFQERPARAAAQGLKTPSAPLVSTASCQAQACSACACVCQNRALAARSSHEPACWILPARLAWDVWHSRCSRGLEDRAETITPWSFLEPVWTLGLQARQARAGAQGSGTGANNQRRADSGGAMCRCFRRRRQHGRHRCVPPRCVPPRSARDFVSVDRAYTLTCFPSTFSASLQPAPCTL